MNEWTNLVFHRVIDRYDFSTINVPDILISIFGAVCTVMYLNIMYGTVAMIIVLLFHEKVSRTCFFLD